MVSDSIFTDRRRRLTKKKQGKARKRLLRAHGSTPKFPLDPPQD
jgi:hypothetical protein